MANIPYYTKSILKGVKGPSFRDLLRKYINTGYQAYSGNAHNTNQVDKEGFEEFCKMLYEDWYYEGLKRKDINNDLKLQVEYFKHDKKFDPKNIEQSGGDTPFYDVICNMENDIPKEYSKDFLLLTPFENQGEKLVTKDGWANEGFLHVYGYRNLAQHRDDVDSRLYLNLKGKNISKFAIEAYKECKKQNLPFYFKFGLSDDRNEPFLFYCSHEKLYFYLEVIKSIKEKNPELFEGTEKVSPNMGIIDGFIGYGEEPLGHDESYNSSRGMAVSEARSQVRDEFKKEYGRNREPESFLANGKPINFRGTSEILIENFAEPYLENLNDLTSEEKERAMEKIKNKAFYEIESWLLRGFKPKNIKVMVFGKTIDIPFSKFDCEETFSKCLSPVSKENNNELILRGRLAKLAYFHPKVNEKELDLMAKLHKEIVKGLKEDSLDPDLYDKCQKYLKILDKPDIYSIDQRGRAIMLTSLANFVANGKVEVALSSNEWGLTYDEHAYDLYENYLGKEKIDSIVSPILQKRNISKDNVALNLSTENEMKKGKERDSKEQVYF